MGSSLVSGRRRSAIYVGRSKKRESRNLGGFQRRWESAPVASGVESGEFRVLWSLVARRTIFLFHVDERRAQLQGNREYMGAARERAVSVLVKSRCSAAADDGTHCICKPECECGWTTAVCTGRCVRATGIAKAERGQEAIFDNVRDTRRFCCEPFAGRRLARGGSWRVDALEEPAGWKRTHAVDD